MAWTSMTNLSTGDLVSEADMDAIRGNIEYLLDPNKQIIKHDNGADYTTTSTSFVDVDATNLSLTITTNGGPVLVSAAFTWGANTGNITVYFDLDVDGASYTSSKGVHFEYYPASTGSHLGGFSVLVDGLTAGSHTFKLQWKVGSGTGRIYSNGSVVLLSAIEL